MNYPDNQNAALDSAFAEYLDRKDAGEDLDPEEFVREHVDCATELRKCLQAEFSMRVLAQVTPVCPDKSSNSTDRNISREQVGESTHVLGEYVLLERIAQGGMGVVYKALQQGLNRVVAVKVIAGGRFANPTAIQRFRGEARLAAKLKHPRIVPIHQIGEENGLIFFSMDYVPGQSLAELLHKGPLPPHRAAEIVMQVAEAVAYAHQQGFLHRDLKPANILADENGKPLVADFGLARSLEDDSDLTRTGEIVGTVSYISPEQASASNSRASVTRESDVYSLGAVLYALLVGRPPFQAENSLDTLLQVREQEPIPPRKFNANISRDLETICLKCLEKPREQRYRSADDLARDLQRFLDRRPIQAKPCPGWKRTWRWCQRHRQAAASILCSLVVLLVGLISFLAHTVQVNSLNGQLADSNTDLIQTQANLVAALGNSERSERQLEQSLYIANMRAASRAYNDLDHREVRRLLDLCLPSSGGEDHRGAEWSLLQRLTTAPHETLRGHLEDVRAVKYSPDGEWLASAGKDGSVRIYRAKSLKLHRRLPASWEGVRGIAFHPSSQSIACCCGDGIVDLFDVNSGKKIWSVPAHPDLACDAAWTPDGRTLMTCGNERWIRLWDGSTGAPEGTIGPNPGDKAITRMALSSNGQMLATATSGYAVVWDVQTREKCFVHNSIYRETSAAFSPGNDWVAFGSLASRVQLIACAEFDSPRFFMSRHRDGVEAVAFSPDGRWGLGGDRGGVLSLWPLHIDANGLNQVTPDPELKQQTESTQILVHEGRVLSVDFSPDSQRIATASKDGLVRVWDRKTLGPLELSRFQGEPVYDAIPLSDGNVLLFLKGKFLRWNPDTGHSQRLSGTQDVSWTTVEEHDLQLAILNFETGLAVSLAGKFNNPNRKLRAALSPNLVNVCSLTLSPEGSRLAGLSSERQLFLMDSHSYELQNNFPPLLCNSLAFSPDGKKLALSRKGSDNVEIRDVITGRMIRPLGEHSAQVNQVAYSPDGKWIASGSEDRSIKVWNAVTGELESTLRGHRGRVTDVAFSPESRSLFSTGWDGTLRVWSLSLKQELLTLGLPTQPAPGEYRLHLSANGKYLLHWKNGKLIRYPLPEEVVATQPR